jgi:cysteinyl-tRNA synthetase
MLTVDGRKMAKSLGNFITLEELFTGNHEKLSQAFSPMVVRFFMLQSHYRSTVDFSDQALIAAERGYHKLMGYLDAAEHELAEEIAEETAAAARGMLERSPIGPRDDVLSTAGTRVPLPGSIQADDEHAGAIASQIDACWRSMADDFHTPRTVAALFELGKLTSHPDHENAPTELRRAAARVLRGFVRHVLGLQPEREPTAGDGDADRLSAAMDLLISMRAEARAEKDFARADRIRDTLAEAGIRLEDGRNGTTWVRD